MTETFYDVLGVSADATTEDIETAYREAIKEVHPDVSDDLDAGERTKRLNKAKKVLTDEDERARYDRLGHDAYTGDGPTADRSTDDSESDTKSSESARSTTSTADSSGGSYGSGGYGPGASGSYSETGDASRASGGVSGADGYSRGESTGDGSTWSGSDQRGRRSKGRKARTGARDQGSSFDGSYGASAEQADASAARSAAEAAHSSGSSTGPSWQSGGQVGASSPSARRQAAAGATDGPNVDWSWNAWDTTRAWAVRQRQAGHGGLRFSRLFPTNQSVVLLASTFVLYPFFVGSALYPAFPVVARMIVALCTLFTFAYLLSIPEAAILIFGLWSVIVPVALLVFPGVGLFSLVGVVGLVSTWVPLGLSVLSFSLVRQ